MFIRSRIAQFLRLIQIIRLLVKLLYFAIELERDIAIPKQMRTNLRLLLHWIISTYIFLFHGLYGG